MFETSFSRHNKIWGHEKFWDTTHEIECPHGYFPGIK